MFPWVVPWLLSLASPRESALRVDSHVAQQAPAEPWLWASPNEEGAGPRHFTSAVQCPGDTEPAFGFSPTLCHSWLF